MSENFQFRMSENTKFQKYVLLVGLMLLTFIYGVGVGTRQWFPYSFLKNAKNILVESRQNEVRRGIDDDNGFIFESLRDDTKYHVVLLAGQSNMVGHGDVDSLSSEDRQLPQNIEYFDFSRSSSLIQNPHRFGPEVSLSQQLHAQFPNKHFLIFKYAVGGSSLLDWSPNWSREGAKITGNPHFGPLYSKFLNKVSDITEGKDVSISALLWMQGERDARIPEVGEKYYANISTLISHLRSDLGQQSVPVLLGRINPPPDRYPAVNKVRELQEKASEDLGHVYLVETDDLAKRDDNLHYNTQGQLELGRRFARILTEIISAQQGATPNMDSATLHSRQ